MNVTLSCNVLSLWAQLVNIFRRMIIILTDSDLQSKSQRSGLHLININYGEFRSDSVMIALKAMNSKLQSF